MVDDSKDTIQLDEKNPRVFDTAFLSLIVCPLTKQPLDYDDEAQELVSKKAGLAYPIREGIAILLPSEARPLEDGG